MLIFVVSERRWRDSFTVIAFSSLVHILAEWQGKKQNRVFEPRAQLLCACFLGTNADCVHLLLEPCYNVFTRISVSFLPHCTFVFAALFSRQVEPETLLLQSVNCEWRKCGICDLIRRVSALMLRSTLYLTDDIK